MGGERQKHEAEVVVSRSRRRHDSDDDDDISDRVRRMDVDARQADVCMPVVYWVLAVVAVH
jgi:hypothetical protein